MQRIARWIVLTAVLLSPWLFGCAEPWAWLLVSLLVNAGAAVWLVYVFREGYANRVAAVCAAGGALILGFAAVQTTPLPHRLVRMINPIAAETQTTTGRIASRIETAKADQLGPASPREWPSISVSPPSTWRAFYLLAACAMIVVVLIGSVTDREELEVVALAIAICGFVMSLFAIIQDFSSTRDIYWFHRPRLGGTLFGPFTNRNHFAAWTNLAISAVLALVFSASRHALAPHSLPWKERLSLLSSRRVNTIVMMSYGIVIMAAAVFLSLSRGGIASLAAAGGLACLVPGLRRSRGIGRRFGLLLALTVAAIVIWLGWHPVVKRLGSLTLLAADPLRDTRFRMTIAAFRLWGASPLLGCGFGGFQHIFPLYQGPELQFGRFIYAHNDYAQLLAEGGVVGTALFAFAAWFFGQAVLRGFRKASDESRLFVLGLLIGVVAIALHSVVDFSLRRPAVAFLFCTVCALCIVATRLPGYGRSYMYETGLSGGRVRFVALVALAGLLWMSAYQIRELVGELAFARLVHWQRVAETAPHFDTRLEAVEESSAEAATMAEMSLLNPDAQLEVILASLRNAAEWELPPELRIRLAAQAETAGLLAVRAAPSDYEYWLWLSRALRVNGKPLPARIAMGRARDLAPPGLRIEQPDEASY